MYFPTEEETLQEIGKSNIGFVQQIAKGMNLSNAEVAITYDDRIQVKEFTIRGTLLPLSTTKEYTSDPQD